MIRKTVVYSGQVQGVGFRFTAQRVAHGRELTGYVKNRPDGRVLLVAEGERAVVDGYLDALERSMAGHIRETEITPGEATGEFPTFRIRH